MSALTIVPMDFSEANAFVEQFHRHHKPMPGCKFSIGVSDGEKIVGVAMVGRPVGRRLDDGWTLEVNRVATDGTKNACSILYAASWRAARAMGYRKLITYILDTGGTFLKATGWKSSKRRGAASGMFLSAPELTSTRRKGSSVTRCARDRPRLT